MTITTAESALADKVARDWLKNYMAYFAPSIQRERATSQAASAVFIDGLAAVTALTIAGGHGNRDEVVTATIKSLRDAIDRDLKHSFGG
jgi:hypothetical protein